MGNGFIQAAQGGEISNPSPGGYDRPFRRPLMAGLAAAAAALAVAVLLAACGNGNGNGSAAAAGGTGGIQQRDSGGTIISTRTIPGIGTVLTDQSGKTLYSPLQEAHGVIKCTASCLSFWFPVTIGNGAEPHAAATLTGTLGSIQRSDDGGRQLTYNGQPLYTFRLDDAPGQTHGNNFSDHFGGQTFTWHAVTSAAGAATQGQPGSSPGYSSYQGGSSGY
jgi:predicted lipoprotein with Yx(FWY)xxD motif